MKEWADTTNNKDKENKKNNTVKVKLRAENKHGQDK